MLRRSYDWVLGWADRPGGSWALFIIAFCESSFFPIPPDILLIALAVGKPAKAFRFAVICSAGSILGALLGYVIGLQFMDLVGHHIIEFYHLTEKMEYLGSLFNRWDAWAISIAGFTPLPFKLFTISAGAFRINLPIFLLAAAFSRTLRFMILAGLIFLFGPGIKRFIDTYFNSLAVAFTVLLVAGFVAVKYLF
ncbi:MAG: DedA family protein [Desulfarculaceae bacterium]|nr:DedA family protein [Desulfarculaceae bacterium]